MSVNQCPPLESWEKLRFLIEDLYVKQDLSLDQVMYKMASVYHFHASASQYRNAFRRWRLRKNLNSKDWVKLHQTLKEHQPSPNSHKAVLNGRLASWKKVKKELSRHVPLHENATYRKQLKEPTMSTVHIQHSFASELDPRCSTKLPWHTFSEILDLSTRTRHTTSGIPLIELASEHFSIESIVTPVQQVITALIDFRVSKLEDLDKSLSSKFFYDYLRSRIVETKGMRLAENIGAIYQCKRELGLYHVLRYFVFLASNNIGNEKAFDQFVEKLCDKNQHLLQAIFTWDCLTAAVILEKIMFSAIRLQQVKLLEDMLHMLPTERGLNREIIDSLSKFAIKQRRENFVRVLIREGLEIHRYCTRRCTLSHWGLRCQYGDVEQSLASPEIVEILISHFATSPPRSFNQHCMQAIFILALGSHSWMVKKLIKAGMKPNASIALPTCRDVQSAPVTCTITPLQAAVSLGSKEHVDILLRYGARVNDPDTFECATSNDESKVQALPLIRSVRLTPMILATMRGDVDLMRLLWQYDTDFDPWYGAPCVRDDANWLERHLLQSLPQSPLSCEQIRPCSPLEAAMVCGYPDIFKQLLEWGSKLEVKYLQSLYKIAREKRDVGCLQILQNHQMNFKYGCQNLVGYLINELQMGFGFSCELMSLANPLSDLTINLSHANYSSAALFYRHIALAGMCRMSDCQLECRDGYFDNKQATPCEIYTISRLMDQNCTFHGTPIDSELWHEIQEELMFGTRASIQRLLEIPQSRRCFRDMIVHGRWLHGLDDYETCECCISKLPPAQLVIDLTNIKFMIAEGYNVNGAQAETSEPTPLLIAIRYNDINLVDLLLESGANPNFGRWNRFAGAPREWYDLTPLEFACHQHYDEIARILITAGASLQDIELNGEFWSSICLSIKNGWSDFSYVQSLLDVGADINAAADGWFMIVTASMSTGGLLWWASRTPQSGYRSTDRSRSREQQLAEIEYLLERGADVNTLDESMKFNMSALQVVALIGDKELVDMYLEHGGDINRAPCEFAGRTAIQAAAEGGHAELVEHLLNLGANLHAPPSPQRGITALQAAAIGGFLPIAEMLIQHGAKVSQAAAPEMGRTALQGAAEHGRLDMVQLLLNHYDGPDLYKDCLHAADLADLEHHCIIANYLREQAKTHPDSDGRDACLDTAGEDEWFTNYLL